MRGTPQRARGRFWSRPPSASGRGLLAVGVLAALVATALPSQAAVARPATASSEATADQQAALTPSPAGGYIVRATAGHLDELVALLRGEGYPISRRIEIIQAAVVRLPAGAADRLRLSPVVASVTDDAAVTLEATTYTPSTDVNSLYNDQKNDTARKLWTKGFTGAGVDVALVDSGVTPVSGLADADKILNGPDLTPESQNDSTRYLDTYGHGTHMAGIIAGRDSGVVTTKAETDSTHFLGVAPDSRIVSVKAADAQGNSDVSQVIAGIDWVVQHAHDPGLNIRVLNLSFGTDATQDYTLDPLAYAVEVAWRAGIVVVVSAGNNGLGGMTNPATDPYVLAVGAEDTRGTASVGDDTVPAFSSQGLGTRLPDVIAPGVHMQSLRVPGSYVDTQYAATGAIDGRFFRGSGTSQAAAFASGVVALLLQAHPAYTPDQIKDVIRASAKKIATAGAAAQGRGVLMVDAALGKVPSATATQTWTPATGTGSLDASRGSRRQSLDGVTLSGEKDINGLGFDAKGKAASEATGTTWTDGTWNGSNWTGTSWNGKSWASTGWSGKTWAGSQWSGKTWASGTWDGKTWASGTWSGSSWAGSSWSGKSWASGIWDGKTWAGAAWADNTWG